METRSNNVLVGTVTLLLVAILLFFTIWLSRFGDGSKQEFDIFFKQSVSGLNKGSSVTFSGVPVGEVSQIVLWKNDPQFVRVRISINEDVPILLGTSATINGIGFTGVSEIQLDGAVKDAPPIRDAGPEGVPVIPTKPGALGEILNSAPLLIERLSTLTERLTTVLSDKNQKSIENILVNVESLSGRLAKQGPEFEQTLKETRIAINRAGIAAEEIGKLAGTTNQLLGEDGRPLLADLRKTLAAANRSMTALEGAANDARPAIGTLSEETLPELNLLVKDLRRMSVTLRKITDRVEQQGVGPLLTAPELPDYKP